jgi:lipoyl(octanoyl) transferase
VDYREALDLQHLLAAAVAEGTAPDTVLFLEHPATITLGRRTEEGEVHVPEGTEVEVVEVDRGGKSTYHAPGQLVCYPILDLTSRGRDLRRYVRALEETVIATLADLDVEGHTLDGPHASGVWVGDRKIASIGVRCARWVTSHGLALNVDSDLEVYELFDACGLGGAQFTSITRETGRPVTTADVRGPLVERLAEKLDLELERLPAAEDARAVV